jgi:hypothetical protein
MKVQPKGPQAARIRQRKFEILKRYSIPDNLLPGSLSEQVLRCGKPNCRCASGPGHTSWTLTFMVQGKKQTLHIPKHLVDQVRQQVESGRQYQDAVRDVLTANAQLFLLARKQHLL